MVSKKNLVSTMRHQRTTNLNWFEKTRFLEAIGPRKLPRPSDPRVSTNSGRRTVLWGEVFTPLRARNSNVPGGLGECIPTWPWREWADLYESRGSVKGVYIYIYIWMTSLWPMIIYLIFKGNYPSRGHFVNYHILPLLWTTSMWWTD